MDEINARKRETFKGLELTEATTLGELCARFPMSIFVQGLSRADQFQIKPGQVILVGATGTQILGVMPLESFKRDFVATTAEPEDDLGLG